jgi:serine/threonine protein kinase
MTACATPQQLERLVNNQLTSQERDSLAAHVQNCDSCQQILEQLTRATLLNRESESNVSRPETETELLQLLKEQGPLFVETANRAIRDRVVGAQPLGAAGAFPVISGFKILRQIGRGGMGVVYEAEEEVLSRRVALKVLPHHALFHPTQLQRFERETKAAARLHHTNIVPLFGVGEQNGLHYYVMQYIDGSGLDVIIDELRRRDRESSGREFAVPTAAAPESPRPGGSNVGCVVLRSSPVWLAHSMATGRFDDLGLFGEGCDHAEPEPIRAPARQSDPHTFAGPALHGDRAKPGGLRSHAASATNSPSPSRLSGPFFQSVARIGLSVAEALEYAHKQGILHRDIKPSNLLLDDLGNVWITDFGLAKTEGADDLTETGDVVGTIRYLAPERFSGRCDVRSDVYSLGLTLYELASLRPAYEEVNRYKLIDRVRHEELPRLKTRVPRVPRDLEQIVQKAIAHDPARRYTRAADLADDLRRFLEGRTIRARRTPLFERSARWCRRNPWVAGLSTAVFVSLIVGTVVSSVQAIRATRAEAVARRQRGRAEAEAKISKAVQEFVRQDMLAQASAHNQKTHRATPDPDLKVRTALDRAAETIGRRFADQPLVEASIRLTVGDTYFQLGLHKEALPHLRLALELRQRILGADDPETCLAMKSLGTLYLEDRKLPEAEPLLEGAMIGLQRAKGSNPGDLIDAVNLVAQLYIMQDKLNQAEEILIRARTMQVAARLGDDLRTLETGAELGVLYLEQNKVALAQQTLVDVLDRSQEALGRDHPFTSNVKQCLADVYQSAGRLDEATKQFIEAIESETKALGRKHPATLCSMARLGLFYANRDKLDQAEPLLIEALAGCRTALARNHDTTEVALVGLGQVYSKRRDFAKLVEVICEAADVARLRWGPDGGQTAAAQHTAAAVAQFQRQYARAEPYFRDYLFYIEKHDPTRPDRFFDELQFGLCLLAQRKYAEAKLHLLIGYHGLAPRPKADPPRANRTLGWLLEQLDQFRDANGVRYVRDTVLSILHKDPALEAIVLDLQFPSDPFAPP